MQRPFTITSRILAHLGEDLIKDEGLALLELVKNSYDAGATSCHVDFEFNIQGELEEISVCDDGCGMDLSTIENVWLVIGTDNKEKQIFNPTNGRVPLGEKGIGRLGVHKLGKEIHLYSKSKGEKEVYVNIDWSKLDTAKGIDDFKIDYGEVDDDKFRTSQTGTFIYIKKLKGEWDNRKLRSVFRDLMSLNSPFDNRSDSFKVDITSNRSHVFRGLPDAKEIMDAGMYFGHCEIEGDKITSFRYEFKPWDSLDKIQPRTVTTLNEYDKQLIHKVEIETDSNHKIKREESLDLSKYRIGKINLDIVIYEKDNSVFGLMNLEKKGLNEYLRENSGIRVYRDGIRVFDYGEKGDDWLSIDKRRINRSGGSLSNNIVVGAVSLDRQSSEDLREKTNREGFIENNAYFAFLDAVTYALDLITIERNKDRTNLMAIYRKGKNTMEPVIGQLSEVVDLVKDKVKEKETQEEILKYLYRMQDQYNDVRDTLIHSANIGINLGSAIHEMDKQVTALVSCIEANDIEKVKSIAKTLEILVSNYSSIMLKTSPTENNISQVAKLAIDNNLFRFQDHRIRIFSNYKKTDFKAILSRTEAIGAVTNLLDNSIYWVSRSRTEGRMIYVYVTDQFLEGYITIAVCDNGPGFKMEPFLAVKPFVTGKPLNSGMGLGLYIATETLKQMGGKLLISNRDEMDLPDTVIDKGIDKAIVTLSFKKA